MIVERCTDWAGPYTVVWACDPPPIGGRFRAIRDRWFPGWECRAIFEWEDAS